MRPLSTESDYDVIDAGFGTYSFKHSKILEHRAPEADPPDPHDKKEIERRERVRAADVEVPCRRLSILAALGDYGAGKTYTGAEFCFGAVTEYTWDQLEAMGFSEQSRPCGAFVAPNWDALLQGPVAKFMEICPPELIERAVLYPLNGRIELTTGWTIYLYTAERMHPLRGGRGPTLCWIWADEIQDAKFAPKGLFRNMRKRARDKRAPRPFVLSTGIPYAGTHVQQLFDRPDTAQRVCVILSTEDNAHNLHPDALDDIELDTPASMAVKDARGWILLASGSIWGNFSDANIVSIDVAAAAKRVTHLGVDLRRHGSVVFAQEIDVDVALAPGPDGKPRKKKEKALLFVDQLLTEHKSAQRIAAEIAKAGRWLIGKGSEIWMDPSVSDDEVQAFEAAFPGATVRRHTTGQYREERAGVECVDTRICDKHGNHRVLIWNALLDDPSRRGLVVSFRLYDGHRHSPFAHTADAGRYVITGRVGLARHSGGGAVDPDANLRESSFSR